MPFLPPDKNYNLQQPPNYGGNVGPSFTEPADSGDAGPWGAPVSPPQYPDPLRKPPYPGMPEPDENGIIHGSAGSAVGGNGTAPGSMVGGVSPVSNINDPLIQALIARLMSSAGYGR